LLLCFDFFEKFVALVSLAMSVVQFFVFFASRRANDFLLPQHQGRNQLMGRGQNDCNLLFEVKTNIFGALKMFFEDSGQVLVRFAPSWLRA